VEDIERDKERLMEQATQVPRADAGHTETSDGAQEQAKAKAGEVKDQAQEKARDAASNARGRAVEQIDQRSTEAGERVSGVAGDVRSVGDELRKQGKDGPAKIADQAAERAEKVGSYLQDSDADRILRDAEDFGRQKPWAVIAGGLVLGFAASRFLKASSQQRYRASSQGAGASSERNRPSGPSTYGNGPATS
jgi:hypothetical protein